ncbi:hypothetical protein NGX30_014505 [Clostridioides difficile]|nr:hypothetical protein [Clostridioides difficile]EIS9354826.1 hypothetical protein [Clostridioides difficile]MBN6007087.1 hypothetical protein [Clostridioides difficile]MCM3860945.1 hypothetical protein [Clostridioides difficile]MCM3860998.1 hypothetical protein [Clostridioides difficile]MCO5908762.1 hypothetical protein [Clostridioides difficile]
MRKLIAKIKSLFKKNLDGIYWSNTESVILKYGNSEQLELLKQANKL